MFEVVDSMRNYKSYDGKTPKFGITVDGTNYIVKVAKKDSLSVYTEYVASHFIKELGFPCHDVYIGHYRGKISTNHGAELYDGLVNVICDFTTDYIRLQSFKDIGQSSVDTDLSDKHYSYNDVMHILDKDFKLDKENLKLAKRHFWDMYVCDAILGNRDRHMGNWGLLQVMYNDTRRLAPMYDNGACLFPDVFPRLHEYCANPYKFLYDRTYVFPASLLLLYSSTEHRYKRTNYGEILKNRDKFSGLRSACNRVISSKGKQGVFNAICKATMGIPNSILRDFWVSVAFMRYSCLVERNDFETSYRLLQQLKGGINFG